MRVAIEKVPVDVRRRGARAVEALVASPVHRDTDAAAGRPALGPEATPIYRPDLDDVAYWELEVTGVRTALPVPGKAVVPSDRGFVIVATGRHDVPVPHFSLELAPPSRQLEELGGPAARIVKVDALCYVAEDAKGTMLAHLGTVPPQLVGVPATAPARLAQGWATTLVEPEPDERAQDSAERARKLRLRSSREARPLRGYGPWESWAALKKGYASSYALHLAALARRAEHPWAVEALTDRFGQGIHEGDTLVVPLLQRGEFEIAGPGGEFVGATLDGSSSLPRLALKAKATHGARDTTFTVTFRYGRTTETLTFFVVPKGAPTTVVPTASPLGPAIGGGLR